MAAILKQNFGIIGEVTRFFEHATPVQIQMGSRTYKYNSLVKEPVFGRPPCMCRRDLYDGCCGEPDQ